MIHGSQPDLVPKLEETIGEYENLMSVVPCSLCAFVVTLYISTDNSSMMHAAEGVKAEPLVSDPRPLQRIERPGPLSTLETQAVFNLF